MHIRLLLIVALLLAGCAPATATTVPTAAETSSATPAPTPSPATATQTPATRTPVVHPTATVRQMPSPTATVSPSTTPTPPPVTRTPLPPATQGQEDALTSSGQALLSQLLDLPRYEIEATVNLEELTVQGRQRVVYTNRHQEPLTELYLNLYPNAERFGGEMRVTGLSVDGQPVQVSYEREQRALRVSLSTPLAPGERTALEMGFSLRVPQVEENRFQVLVYSKDILSLAGWYPTLAVLDDAGWHLDYPDVLIGEAMLAESAFYAVQITVPEELVVAASGVQVEETAGSDGTRALSYRSGPSRTFYLSASPDYQVASGEVGEVSVHSYYLPGHESCGGWVLEAAIAALQLYGELYGPYPFAEFDVVEADQWYQGMEWPGLMLLGTMFYDGRDPACGEWFVAHEVAHQWWYNVVGNDPVAHPWLDESLAQYSAMLYFRRLWPPDAAEAYIQAIVYDRYAPYAERAGGIHLDQSIYTFEDREVYYAIAYARGAMFWEAAHQALGEEAFFSALRRIYQDHQFSIVTPADFYAAFRQADLEKADTLWREWVASP